VGIYTDRNGKEVLFLSQKNHQTAKHVKSESPVVRIVVLGEVGRLDGHSLTGVHGGRSAGQRLQAWLGEHVGPAHRRNHAQQQKSDSRHPEVTSGKQNVSLRALCLHYCDYVYGYIC